MMALTQMTSLSLTNLHLLIQELGSAVTIYENRNDLRQVLPSASKKTLDGMGHFDTYLARAEQELEFCRKGKIQCLGLNDEGYPQRLRDCNDAPILLYYRGTADLNQARVVNIVGTDWLTAWMCIAIGLHWTRVWRRSASWPMGSTRSIRGIIERLQNRWWRRADC